MNASIQQTPPGSRRSIRRGVGMWCELISSRCEQPSPYLATDLSPQGIWLQTSDPVRAGENVVVCFEPNDGWRSSEIVVFAEVARVVTSRRRIYEPGVGMGLEFIDLSADERHKLIEWLSQRRAPIQRRRRPTARFRVPQPEMTQTFDEIRGTIAVRAVEPTQMMPPVPHRPLRSCWR